MTLDQRAAALADQAMAARDRRLGSVLAAGLVGVALGGALLVLALLGGLIWLVLR